MKHVNFDRRTLAGALVGTMVPGLARAQAADEGSHGFDFLKGAWHVRHRRLKSALAGSKDWDEFDGELDVSTILGGMGDVDRNVLNNPKGRYLATTLRLFSPKTGLWSIYWIDGRNPSLDNPLVGRFEGGKGQFYNDDSFGGRPIRVRFTYENVAPDRAAWNQAFSADAGQSWEINWTMDFMRVMEPGAWIR